MSAATMWSAPTVSAAEPQVVRPPVDLMLQHVALHPGAPNKPTTLSVRIGSEEDEEIFEEGIATIVIGTLRPGTCEQLTGLQLRFDEDERLEFIVNGPGSVSLVGCFIHPADAFLEGAGYGFSSSEESESEGEDEGESESDSGEEETGGKQRGNPAAFDDGQYGSDSVDSDEADADGSAARFIEKSRKRSATQGDDARGGERASKRSKDDHGNAVEKPKADEQPQAMSKKERRRQAKLQKQKGENNPAAKQQQEQLQKQQQQQEKKSPKSKQERLQESQQKERAKANEIADSIVTKRYPGGLIVEELKLGNGPLIKAGHNISVKYVGKLASGKTFDSSLNKPFRFRFGVGEVIKGWDSGLKGMKVGGKRRLTIPPALGYGNEAVSGIPRNSTLHFDVEVVRNS